MHVNYLAVKTQRYKFIRPGQVEILPFTRLHKVVSLSLFLCSFERIFLNFSKLTILLSLVHLQWMGI